MCCVMSSAGKRLLWSCWSWRIPGRRLEIHWLLLLLLMILLLREHQLQGHICTSQDRGPLRQIACKPELPDGQRGGGNKV